MVKIILDISKKYSLSAIVILLVIIGAIGVYAVWDVNKKVYHNAGDVKISINGTEYSLQEAVDTGLIRGGQGQVSVGSRSLIQITTISGDVSYNCSSGQVLTGVMYDNDGDNHISGILCSPLQ